MDLARRRRQEVVTADDLIDALRRVVDDDGEVVGGHAVVAPEDEVVDSPAGRSVHRVDELDHLTARPQTKGRRAACAFSC